MAAPRETEPSSSLSDTATPAYVLPQNTKQNDALSDPERLTKASMEVVPPAPSPKVFPSEHTPLLSTPRNPHIQDGINETPSHDNVSSMAMFWEELPTLTEAAVPLFATQLLQFTMIIVPVVSIGHMSTTALAGISLGSMTANVTGFSVIQGFCSALDTLMPSAWTSSHPQYVGLWAQRMSVVMACLMIPITITWLNANSLLLRLKQDPEVADLASQYLRWITLALPAFVFNTISRRYFQSQGLFTVPTRIILLVAPINAFLGWFLVWGPKPFNMGFIGAPIASVISYYLISLASFTYGARYTDLRAWHPLTTRMFTHLGRLIRLGLAGVGQVCSEWWAWELVMLAASVLGPTALASQSVLLTSCSATFQAPFSIGVASSVRIGNLLGERRGRRAGVAANTSFVMAVGVMLLTSAMFMILRPSWGRLFNNDEAVVSLVADVLPIVALFQVFDGAVGVTGGIMRARGIQLVGAILNLSGYYVVGIPLGLWLAFTRHMGLKGLWYGLTVSLIYCSVVASYLCLTTDWDLEVEKVAVRLKEEERLRHADTLKADDGGERGDIVTE
ncbi:mate-domain-containing protein [Ephemerocybe angulata]|uniref:Mate-domain-containing protein n=1 Tax=Ephemerocybe angulata TaxID=980116 RepID=A0A8H6LZU0_9AGAR|nr:mate-domain-containing protein [Tulosesus angulatus]